MSSFLDAQPVKEEEMGFGRASTQVAGHRPQLADFPG